MTTEAIVIAAVSLLSNGVVALVGFLAKNALTGLQTKVDHIVASQTATEKIVAVMEVRIGGEVTALKADMERLEVEVTALRPLKHLAVNEGTVDELRAAMAERRRRKAGGNE